MGGLEARRPRPTRPALSPPQEIPGGSLTREEGRRGALKGACNLRGAHLTADTEAQGELWVPPRAPAGRGHRQRVWGPQRAPDPDTRHKSHSSRPRAVPAPGTRDKVPSAGGESSCDRKLEPSAARGRGVVAAAACPATGAAACSDPGSRRHRGPCQSFRWSNAHQVRHPGDKGSGSQDSRPPICDATAKGGGGAVTPRGA